MKIYQLKDCSYNQKNLCWKYADAVIESCLPKLIERNQNSHKVYYDAFQGKLAEFMVFNYFNERGYKTSEPDLNIYDGKNKSFNADLIVNQFQIHVKSCDCSSNFPISWVFQPEDILTSNPSNFDYLALVYQSLPEYGLLILKASDVIGLYKPALASYLNKKVLYFSDL